jgi:hypothetical protein
LWSAEMHLLDMIRGDKVFDRDKDVPMNEDTEVVSFLGGVKVGRHGERFGSWLACVLW